MSNPQSLPVLYRDDALLVVDKPSGLLVHNGWARERVTALTLARKAAGHYVFPIHRLDRATSGVLVFALSSEIARAAQESLASAETTKRYLALVRGITPDFGRIDYPLAREGSEQRRPAITDYRRLGSFERYSLVEATLRTGRQHQVRRHFKHISHPLIGDVKYGKGEHNRMMRERFALHRLVLHAFELSWIHPIDGQPLVHLSGIPAELAEPFRAMGLLQAVPEQVRP